MFRLKGWSESTGRINSTLGKNIWKSLGSIKTVFIGQTSSSTNVKAGVPQGFVLGSLSYLIYINDLADGLSSKIFADDTCVFSVIYDSVITTWGFNSDLARNKQCAFQWKIGFNADLN